MLAVIETHPVQYHAPVYRAVQEQFKIPVTVIYGSDFSVVGYKDREFGSNFAWDVDLLSGYTSLFLSHAAKESADSFMKISARGLAQTLRQVAPSAVLIGGYNLGFYRAALFSSWKENLPVLFRGETTDHARQRGTIKNLVRSNALRMLYQRCARLLYIGQQSLQHYKRLGCTDDKLIFSPYCVDTSPFETDEHARQQLRAPTRGSLGIAPEQTVILFSGKLRSRKGPDLLLEAIKKFPTEVRNKITVVFLGHGELKDDLERQAQAAPALQIRFVGFKNQTELSPYYHAADLLAVPSRHSETWGLVVNDALHHGVPCVVSDMVGCALDLVEANQTGEVFEAHSVEGLHGAIERALQLCERPEIREKCRQKVSLYSVEQAALGIVEAYRGVTG